MATCGSLGIAPLGGAQPLPVLAEDTRMTRALNRWLTVKNLNLPTTPISRFNLAHGEKK